LKKIFMMENVICGAKVGKEGLERFRGVRSLGLGRLKVEG
jgi:hypothetical protein